MALKKRIVLITPALANANNGNWQTAKRWSAYLSKNYCVDAMISWDQAPADCMIALHARRSGQSIENFAASGKPIALILTGTDLYRDIQTDDLAKQSLRLATRLVTLQDAGIVVLPEQYQSKTSTIYQSAKGLKHLKPRANTFDCVMVGHLRDEKDPLTAIRAVLKTQIPRLRLRVIGDTNKAEVGKTALQLSQLDARIQWLGALPNTATRREIRRAQILIIPSIMEGGANVIIEAVTSGTAVLASRINGSIGMLGEDYQGYFTVGDSVGLARLLERCNSDPSFMDELSLQCAARAALFDPLTEKSAVLNLVQDLIG